MVSHLQNGINSILLLPGDFGRLSTIAGLPQCLEIGRYHF